MRISYWSSDVCSSDLGGLVAGYRVLAIGERFAGCGRLKLRYRAFAAQIDCHVVGEELDRDDAIVLAEIGVARFDRWRQRHLHVLDDGVLRAIRAGELGRA